MTTSINPIKEAVQAAIYFARYKEATTLEYGWAFDIIQSEITFGDRERGYGQLAAAARILADEVERLRAETKSIALSDCCEAVAVVAGKPNSTQWYVCPQCCQPCDVFYQDKNTQPL